MARRAASIWRAVIRSGSIDFSPWEPKFSAVPPLAAPWILPLNCLRNLVFFGDSIGQPLSVLRLAAALAARAAVRTATTFTAASLARRPALAGQALVEGHGVVLEHF